MTRGPSTEAFEPGAPRPEALLADGLRRQAPARAVSGRDRFRALVAEHFDFTWRALRGLGVPSASADDAAQQVFLVASRKIDAIRVGAERAFLFETARRIAANARRSRNSRPEVSDEESLARCADTAPDPEESSSMQQSRALLDAALDAMPEDLREVFVLFELEEVTMAEIAAMLDLPPGTVASRLRRAREAFREIVARQRAKRGGPA